MTETSVRWRPEAPATRSGTGVEDRSPPVVVAANDVLAGVQAGSLPEVLGATVAGLPADQLTPLGVMLRDLAAVTEAELLRRSAAERGGG